MKINRGFIYSILSVILPILLRLIFLRFISYSMDEGVYGRILYFETILAALTQVIYSIPSQSFNKFFNSSSKEKFIPEFHGLYIIINIIVVIITLVLFFTGVFEIESELLIIFFLYLFILSIFNTSRDQSLLELKRIKYLRFKLIESVSRFLLPILFYVLFKSIESYFFGILMGLLIGTLISYKSIRFNLNLDIIRLKKYWVFASPIALTALFSWSISLSDRFFIEYFFGESKLGVYGILYQVAFLPLILGNLFNNYANPIIFKIHSEDKYIAFEKLFYYIKISAILLLVLLVSLILIPKETFYLLINSEILAQQKNYISLIFLLIACVFSILQNIFSFYLVLNEKLILHSYFFLIACIVNFSLNFLIKSHGMIAAAFSTLISYFLLFILIFFYVIKNYKEILSKK